MINPAHPKLWSASDQPGAKFPQFIVIFVKMEPTKKVGSIILAFFWRSVDNRHSLLSLMQMVMPFVQIAAHRWNVEVQGLQTLKNTIRQATPAKMLEISVTRIRRKRTQAYSTILKGQKPLQFPWQSSILDQFTAID